MTQRLYPTITPLGYTLLITPNLSDFTFHEEETITFTTENASSSFTFHAFELHIRKASLTFGEKVFTPKDISYNEGERTVTFTFTEELPAGEKKLELVLDGILGEKAKGFYRSHYEVAGTTKYMAVTQFEEIGARQAFVCIDDPSAKATFDIAFITDDLLTVVSNTKEKSEATIGNGQKKVIFETTPKMSTYILAFIVGELEYEEKYAGAIRIRAYTTKGKKELTRFCLDTAGKVITFFNSYFGIDYPLSKLDLFAIPDFDAGAMENWGAVTFRESILLIDEEKSSSANKQWGALVVAHELAHMWFGNLVTMDWWTDLWLNEGFACYIEYLCIDHLFPSWELWKQFSLIEHTDALKLDSLKFTHPIEIPIASDQEVKEIFDEISYAKGANVIHMLASYLGEDVFRDGLRFYLKKHAYGNAKTEDLWKALEEVSKQPVGAIMGNWTKESGYPILHVEAINNEYMLSQSRFFANPFSKEEKNTTWNIPMRVFLGNVAKTDPLLVREEKVTIPRTSWIKVNAGETALVRALYSEDLYRALEKVISGKSLSAVDRMGIIRDAFDSAEAGLVASTQALGLLAQYRNEDDYIVWSTITGQLGSLENILYHIHGLEKAFESFASEIFTPIAVKMGWEKREKESHTDILLRGLALRTAGKYGNKDIIAKAQELFQEFTHKGLEIDSDIRGVVLALASENGGDYEWQQLVHLYEKEVLQQEKNRYLLALTQAKSIGSITKTLDYILTDNVRWQDKSRFIMAMFGNAKAQDITWNFIKSHWDLFEKEYKGLHGFSRLVEGLGTMVGEEILKDVETFFYQHPTPELGRTIHQAVERIQLNTAWLERDREKLVAFFNE